MNSEPSSVFLPARRLLGRIKRLVTSALASDPDRFLKFCKTIVHVGANVGQERFTYDRFQLSVFWIEPIPAVYDELVENLRSFPKQVAVQALLTDQAGKTVKLNISNNSSASSSIFELALHKDIWPEVDYVDRLQMRTDTLDGLVERGTIRLPVDAIVLDTQGSEYLVLQGAEAVLSQVNYVKVEAADFESYKGGATVKSIESFLTSRSFSLVRKTKFAEHPSAGGYYDLLFKKTTL